MSGAVFQAAGASTGPAPRTVWMSPLADRLTVLRPFTESLSTIPAPPYNVPPLLANQFLTYRTSFGAFTTAPDGTSASAQHITEDSSNNTHYIGAELRSSGGAVPAFDAGPVLRLAGIFQAAERTRIQFFVSQYDFNAGATVGFDLSGVQIAYGPTDFFGAGGSTHVIFNKGASIVSLGGGWCLCILDFINTHLGFGQLIVRILLDNGAGTAPASTSYLGNGTNGVYGWKQSLLPRQAWKINSVSYFDDYTNLNNVDVNDTRQAGFTWYVSNQPWPSRFASDVPGAAIMPPGTMTIQGGTVLHVPAGNPSGTPWGLTSACPGPGPGLNPGSYVGIGWKPPFYLEHNSRYGYSEQAGSNVGGDTSGIVMYELEYYLTLPFNPRNYNITGGEYDIWLAINLSEIGNANLFGYESEIGMTRSVGGTSSLARWIGFIGCPPVISGYLPTGAYGPNTYAFSSGGNFYKADGSNTNALPPTNPPWTAYTYGGGVVLDNPEPVVVDLENTYHTMGTMILPHDPLNDDPGCTLQFFDGNFKGILSWAYTNPAIFPATEPLRYQPYLAVSDWQRWFLNLFPCNTPGSGGDWWLDWLRVSQ